TGRGSRGHSDARARRARFGRVRPGSRLDVAHSAGSGRPEVHRADQHADHHHLDGRLFLLPADDRGLSPRWRLVHRGQGEPGYDRRPARRRRAHARLRAGRCRRYLGGCRSPGFGTPMLQPHTLALCLAILALLTVVNLRGVRESGIAFMVPTYLFVVTLLAVLAYGALKALAAGGHPTPVVAPAELPQAQMAGSLWIFMRAFASGCTAMTGVEAVSNGVM